MIDTVKCELYITANGKEFISSKFNMWRWEKDNYMTPLSRLFLQDIIIHTIYRLIKNNKLDKVNLEDAYINMYDDNTGEVIPVVSYMDDHKYFPNGYINDDIYTVDDTLNPKYTSLFDIQKRLGNAIQNCTITRNLPQFNKPENLSSKTKPKDDDIIKFTFDKSEESPSGLNYYNYLRYYIQRYILLSVYPEDNNHYYINELNDWIDSL